MENVNFGYTRRRTNLINVIRRRKRPLQVMFGVKKEKITWFGTCIVRNMLFVPV
jgi:hypothetical protein